MRRTAMEHEKIYAAKNKDIDVLVSCSLGAMFLSIAKEWLKFKSRFLNFVLERLSIKR